MRKMSMEQGEKCPWYEERGCVSEHRKLKLLQNKKPTKILKRCWRAVIPELQGTVGNLPKVSREGLHGCPPRELTQATFICPPQGALWCSGQMDPASALGAVRSNFAFPKSTLQWSSHGRVRAGKLVLPRFLPCMSQSAFPFPLILGHGWRCPAALTSLE